MSKYRAHNWHCLGGRDRQPYAALYTTLGCPYHCSFCCIQAPFKSGEEASGYKPSVNTYRAWSPDRVIEQIDLLVERHGVRNLKIADEMFVLNRRHVLGICDRIIERGYDLNIWAYTRVDTIKDGMLEKLREAGFRWLAVGVEAGADRVRADVDKGFAQEEVYRVIERICAAGIHVIGNYIFGLPEDDLDTMKETLDLAIDLNCEFANFYSAMAYPGSPLYAAAVRQGVPLPRQWSGYSQHAARLPTAANAAHPGARSAPLPRRGVPQVLHTAALSRRDRPALWTGNGCPHSADDELPAGARSAYGGAGGCGDAASPRGTSGGLP